MSSTAICEQSFTQLTQEPISNSSGQKLIGDSIKQAQLKGVKPDLKVVRSEDTKRSNLDTDQTLVLQVLGGNKKAFDILVIKYQRQITRVVARYVSDQEMVKDVVQETFIRAYKALKSYRFESRFYTWLYRIAANSSYNYLKSNRSWLNKVELIDDEALDDRIAPKITEPEILSSNNNLGVAIEKSVGELPIELKTVLMLREKEGLNYEQIADIVGCELGTVKSRISRARARVIQKTGHLYEKSAR